MSRNKVFKIKLPRKRKKALLRLHRREDYLGIRLLNEILYKENPNKKSTRFIKASIIDGILTHKGYW